MGLTATASFARIIIEDRLPADYNWTEARSTGGGINPPAMLLQTKTAYRLKGLGRQAPKLKETRNSAGKPNSITLF